MKSVKYIFAEVLIRSELQILLLLQNSKNNWFIQYYYHIHQNAMATSTGNIVKFCTDPTFWLQFAANILVESCVVIVEAPVVAAEFTLRLLVQLLAVSPRSLPLSLVVALASMVILTFTKAIQRP